jgi:hypothetical protein
VGGPISGGAARPVSSKLSPRDSRDSRTGRHEGGGRPPGPAALAPPPAKRKGS